MPKTLTIHELFGRQSADAQPPADAAPPEEAQDGGLISAEQLFGVQPAAPTPSAQPQQQAGGQRVPGVPYPVAPADALGMPKDLEQPSGITRFAEELPGVIGDVAQATKGVIRDTLWEDMTDDEKAAGKRLFDGLREIQATRVPLQGAMQFTKTLHGVINHPLALAGIEEADDNANQADRIVTALGQENSRRAAEGLIAQAFGETAGEISESVGSSLVEQLLGARFLGGAGKAKTALDTAKRATRAAMAYTYISSGNHALTEADDMGLKGAKRWGYAGSIGTINAAFIAAGGKAAQRLGLEDVAQAMFSDTTPIIGNVLAKSGVTKALTTLLKGLGGAGVEGVEEAGTEFTAGLTKAAFDGDPEGALDRMIAKTQDKEFLQNVGMAGLTGVAARGAVGAAKNLSTALAKAKEMLPESLTQIGEATRSRKMIEQLDTEREQEGVTTPEITPETPPEAPVAPDGEQTPVTPPAEGAPVAAPQGAPLAPAPDAAEAAPPSVEPVAGTPPAAAPVTPPGEAQPLWRETDVSAALAMIDPNTHGNSPHGTPELFFSDNPDLALGQGANKGVRVEVEGRGLALSEHVKPGTQIEGVGREYVAKNQPREFNDRIRSVTITPDADPKSGEVRRLRNVLKQKGFTATETEAGEVWSPAPEADAQTEPAVETPAGPAVSQPHDPIKLANAPMAELARTLGRGESYYSPGTRGLREAGELAVAADIPERALGIATDVLENGRVLTSVEEIGLGLRLQKLTAQIMQNRVRMNSATDETEIRTLAAEANTLGADFDIINSAREQGGTDPARLLAYRRWRFPDDLTEESLVARIKVARKAPATAEDKAFAKKVSKEHADNAKKLETARKAQKEAVAKEALVEIKKEGAPTESIADINARIRELLEAGCNLE